MTNEWPGTGHEGMRLLILSKFEDDVLQRQEVETWLDGLAVPGEPGYCDCEELGFCYCSCKVCEECREAADASKDGEKEVKE